MQKIKYHIARGMYHVIYQMPNLLSQWGKGIGMDQFHLLILHAKNGLKTRDSTI